MSKSHSTRRHRRLILLENRAMDTRHHRVHEGGEKQGANNRVLLGQFNSKWGNLAPLGSSTGRQGPKASVWSSLHNCQFKRGSRDTHRPAAAPQTLVLKPESQSLLRLLQLFRGFCRERRDKQARQHVW